MALGVYPLALGIKLREPRIHLGREVNIGVLPFRIQALKFVLRGVVGGSARRCGASGWLCGPEPHDPSLRSHLWHVARCLCRHYELTRNFLQDGAR